MWDTLESAKFNDRISSCAMTIFFGAVALLTLALGGIGVMNIMLVAVSERTREIGVRKALGATSQDVRRQFLAESAIITLVSGALGLAGGVGIMRCAAKFIPLPDFIPHPVRFRRLRSCQFPADAGGDHLVCRNLSGAAGREA